MQHMKKIFLIFVKFSLTILLRLNIISCNKYVISIFWRKNFIMSKYKVWTRILMTVSSICVLSTATVFAAASGSINDDGVNIRSAASIGSEILGTADKGTELVLHGRDGDWYQVTFNGNQNAYVSADYFDITRAEGKVQGTNINVRTGSNTKSDVIKTVNDGDVITVIGKLDGWYQLAYNNGNAYISKDYLDGDMLTYLPSVSATEEIEEETAKDSGSQRQSETDTHTLPDAVVFLRTEVLPDKGSHRDAVSTQDHPEETVNLTECGPCSDCIGAKRVDRRLDNHIGDCVHI